MRDRKVQEILTRLIEDAAVFNKQGQLGLAAGINAAVSAIKNEVKILENRKQERFSKKLIREENTEKYREDLYG